MEGRRTPRPASWLQLVTGADGGFVGEATTVEDLGEDDTGSRNPGYRVWAEIERRRALFGDAPERVELEGTTSLPAEERGEETFPPDTLRQTPFWDDAAPGERREVLVLLGEAPALRRLRADDWLPDDVAMIRRWAEGNSDADKVLSELAGAPAGPVAFVAGFELLTSAGEDPGQLFERFAKLPRHLKGALAGVVRHLRVAAPEWSDNTLVAVASTLLAAWAGEDDPATLAEYVTWFDAGSGRVVAAAADLRGRIEDAARRTTDLTFSGDAGPSWQETLQQRAGTLLANLGGQGGAG